MDDQLKRRLIGATVLMSLAIIFLPMLLTHKPAEKMPGQVAGVPSEPPRQFDPSLLRDDTQIVLPTADSSPKIDELKQPAEPPPPSRPKLGSVQPSESTPVLPPKPTSEPLRKPPVITSGWVVQAASLSNRESAWKLVRKLRRAGFDTMDPQRVTVKGKQYYRVRVGPELNKHRAEQLLPRIKRITKVPGRVVRYP